MATIPQYYAEGGAPFDIGIDPLSVAPTWFAHRDRLTGWLADLPDDAWGGPTRCDGWTVSELVRHLASVSQFEGFTLHQAAKGDATRLLEGMDTQETPGAAAALLGDLDPGALLETMRGFDAQIDTTVDGWSAVGRRTCENEFDLLRLVAPGLVVPEAAHEPTPKDGFYLTDAFSDNAAQFIEDHAKDHAARPFFLYTAYTSPHWPLTSTM